MNTTTDSVLPGEIATARLRLRPFRFSDVGEVHDYLQDPDMGRYLEGRGSPPTEAETAAIIARHILADRALRCVWALTIADRPIGAISINLAKEGRIAEIGYSVKKPLWGQGYAGEATRAVVDVAFESLPDLQRMQANIHPDNEGSIRVARRAGMDYEGTLRAYSYVRGEVADEVVYAVVRTGWQPGTTTTEERNPS